MRYDQAFSYLCSGVTAIFWAVVLTVFAAATINVAF